MRRPSDRSGYMADKALMELVADYIFEAFSAEPEHLWMKWPDNAVFRCQRNRKWSAVLLPNIAKRNFFPNTDGTVDVLNLKCDPRMSVVDCAGIFPAYHMSKEHWISVLLDETVPLEQIKSLIELS